MSPSEGENELVAKLRARDADAIAAAYDGYGALHTRHSYGSRMTIA